MTRRNLSTRDRVKVFNAAGGVCHLCGMKIDAGQEWDVSHAIPLAIGGQDDFSNMLPAHRRCHRQHTAQNDAPRIAKTKRQYAMHIGAKQPAGRLQSRGFPKAPPQNRASTPLNKWFGYRRDRDG